MNNLREKYDFRKILSLAVFVFPFFISLIPAQGAFNSHHIKNYIAFLIIITITIIIAIVSMRKRHQISINSFILLFIGYIAVMFVSAIVNAELKRAVPDLLVLFVIAMLLIIAECSGFSTHSIKLYSFTVGIMIFFMLGLSFLFSNGIRLVLFTYNANYLAALLSVSLPFLVAGLLTGIENAVNRNEVTCSILFFSLAIITAIFLIFRTGSRAGVICGGLGMFILFIVYMYKKKMNFLKIMLLSFFIIAVSVLVYNIVLRFRVNLNFSGRNPSFPIINFFGPRIPEWNAAIMIWQSDNPLSFLLGRGPGSYLELSNYIFPADFRLFVRDWNTGRSVMHAHNEILNHLAETGIIGLFFWIMLVLTRVTNAFKILKNEKGCSNAWFSSAVALSAVSTLILFSMIDASMSSISIRTFFYLVLILPVKQDWPQSAKGRLIVLNSSKVYVSVLLFLIFIFFMGSRFYLPVIKADRVFRESVDLSIVGEDAQALKKMNTALAIEPDNVIFRYEMMKVLLRMRESERAVEAGIKILEDVPGYRKTERLLSAEMIRKGDYLNAISYLEDYLRRDTVEKGTHLQRIACAAILDDHEKIIQGLEELIYWSSIEALYYIDGHQFKDETDKLEFERRLFEIRDRGVAALISREQIKMSAYRILDAAETDDFMSVYSEVVSSVSEIFKEAGFITISQLFSRVL